MSTAFSDGFAARNRIEQAQLARLTTMRVGGPARLVTLQAREDLPELLGQRHRWLGKGANLLVGDEGVDDLVVRLGESFAALDLGQSSGGVTTVTVGAALDLAKLIAACVQNGLAGPEGLAGVPATVGGALRMNAGTSTSAMLDWVSAVEVVLPGSEQAQWIERAAMPATYRNCGLPNGTLFLACEMNLSHGEPEQLRATAARLKKAKAASQPLALPSAGCMFKNPSRECPAGKLIEELGLKGTRAGGAVISPVHANFIVNEKGAATAGDVAELVRVIRRRAWQERGVVLHMEVETWNCPDDLRAHPKELVEVA
jgi:UDP-N-acetylmuramate dehydrogenase